MAATDGVRAIRSRPAFLSALLLATVLASCGAPAGTPAPTKGGVPPSATASLARATTFEEFRDAFCAAWTSVFTAWGNPDTGSGSDLSLALGGAIERGDTAAIADLASRIRAELERGRAHAASGAGWAPGAGVMEQTDRFLVALEAGLDAHVANVSAGAAAAKEASQAAFQKAGGIEAWSAMFAAGAAVASARPRDTPTRACPSIPMSL